MRCQRNFHADKLKGRLVSVKKFNNAHRF
jgi:hypothetical protein